MNREDIKFFLEKGFLINPELMNIKKEDIELDFKNKRLILKNKGFNYDIKIIKNYNEDVKKKEIQDFVLYFRARYNSLKKILKNRIELQNSISINRIKNKKEDDKISLIGLIYNKKITKNSNIILELEDASGNIEVIISKKNEGLYNLTKEIVLDEVIGLNGIIKKRDKDTVIFVNNIFFPDIPKSKELKKIKEEIYIAFIADLHVGSKMFLEKEFKNFIKWINCKTSQKEIASKIKYLFIVGDLIDGIGIYPGQEDELEIKDVYKQYEKCAELLSEIRNDIKIIICAGNHDALRISEPQPVIYRDLAKSLWDMKNVEIVSNPAVINILSSKDFPGFDVFLYHGYSFDHYIRSLENIRNNGGYDRADLMMKFLLQKRHLAPEHSSTLYIPDVKEDPLVIDIIPDFFITAHIHKSNISTYNNITTICCSCWQDTTTFQEKVGHIPDPCKIPVVNLQTRDVKIVKIN